MVNLQRSMISQLILCLVFFLCGISALKTSVLEDKSVLVIYDGGLTNFDDYSNFIDILEQNKYELSYHDLSSDESLLQLTDNSQMLYQNLIIFPSKAKDLGNKITGAQLLDFTNDGGNILTITSPDALQGDVKVYLNEMGIFPSLPGYKIVDHFSFDEKLAKSTHDILKLETATVINDYVISPKPEELIYSGSVALLSNSQLLVPILQAPRTSYTVKKESSTIEEIYSSGTQGYMAVGVQGRNNARNLWIGSDVFFSNKYFKINKDAIEDLIDWTFLAKNVIKSTGVEHFHASDRYSEELYKVTDEVVYNIGISEWNGTCWIPYKADDVQVEVRMLDPYYRLNLVPLEESGESQIYTSNTFKLPDQHGVFTFYTNYKRSGLSFIEEKNVVTVRHLANDEYQRSWEIPNAWVYVASNITVVFSFFMFVVIFLYKK